MPKRVPRGDQTPNLRLVGSAGAGPCQAKPRRSERGLRRALAGPTLVPWKPRKGAPLRPVPRGKYGVVRITRGRCAGHLGFYDDDDVMGTSIVYPWGSAPASYIVVRHSSLAEATSTEAKLWVAVNANPFALRTVANWFKQHRLEEP